MIITDEQPYHLCHRWPHLSITYSRPFFSGDIFKRMHNSRDASKKKKHADLDWQLYIWGQCDLVLMLRLPTWLMRPRSVLTGHWAAGHSGQSWTVGKRLRLRSCDWPKARRPASDDFTSQRRRGALIPRWKSESATEMIKRVWKNNGDEIRWCRRRGGRRGERIKGCQDVMFLSFSFTVVAFFRTYPFFLAWRKSDQLRGGKKKKLRAWLNFLCNVIQCHSPLTESAHQMLYI